MKHAYGCINYSSEFYEIKKGSQITNLQVLTDFLSVLFIILIMAVIISLNYVTYIIYYTFNFLNM